MTSSINKIAALKARGSELDEDGNALMHDGKAKAIYKLIMLIDVETAYPLMRILLRRSKERQISVSSNIFHCMSLSDLLLLSSIRLGLLILLLLYIRHPSYDHLHPRDL